MGDGGTGADGTGATSPDTVTPPTAPPADRPAWLPDTASAAGTRDAASAVPPAARPAGAAVAPAGRLPAPRSPVPQLSDHRPRIIDESGILGLSRVSRSRFGARVFTWFFVFVFALIVVQMIVALVTY